MAVNCYNYALVVNPEIKPIFLRNKEGTWQLQVSVLMYSWECPEAAFNSKELRLEINIAATKSNATGKHTCHDLIINLWDANTGIQYAYSNICITIREDKPYIVGEKAGVFNILTKNLSNLSLEENIALINTTPLEKVFWAFAYDPLPCEDFMEEVALRDVTEEEARLLLSDLLNNLSLVMETSAFTTNTQNMIMLKTKVATTAYIGELTIAGLASSKEGPFIASQYGWSKNYTSQDNTSDFAGISIKMDIDHWVVRAVDWRHSRRNYYSPPTEDGRINRIITPLCDLVKSKKNLMRSNSDYSVTGSAYSGVLEYVAAADVSTKDKDLGVSWIQKAKIKYL